MSLQLLRLLCLSPLQELEQGVPMAQRVRAMKELHEIVATKRLEEVGRVVRGGDEIKSSSQPRSHSQHAVQAIWQAIKDLVDPSQPVEARHAALVFTRALIRGQVGRPSVGPVVILYRQCQLSLPPV